MQGLLNKRPWNRIYRPSPGRESVHQVNTGCRTGRCGQSLQLERGLTGGAQKKSQPMACKEEHQLTCSSKAVHFKRRLPGCRVPTQHERHTALCLDEHMMNTITLVGGWAVQASIICFLFRVICANGWEASVGCPKRIVEEINGVRWESQIGSVFVVAESKAVWKRKLFAAAFVSTLPYFFNKTVNTLPLPISLSHVIRPLSSSTILFTNERPNPFDASPSVGLDEILLYFENR